MIPKQCKRLAEVDFPIAVVSKHSAREKSIRHGHPSTLHLWWARRPLAACRAMLMALLLPDPCDAHCPPEFKDQARNILLKMHGRPGGWTSLARTDEGLRQTILKFIGGFADWDHSADKDYLETGRALVKAAHPEETPLVVDPFAGGGSIPLEALRLGCEAFASDLNPVACLILEVMLEDIPRWAGKTIRVKGPNGQDVDADGLAEALRIVGKQIKEQAEKELSEFYPKDSDGATPIAYLWARTVRCEAPRCGAEIPLMRSFWLCKKAGRLRALRLKVNRSSGPGFQPSRTGFQPVNPWRHPSLGIQTRHLPHLQTPDATYFVTFRCAKGVQLPDNARDIVLSAIKHWNGEKIDLDAAVVMPDHVHMIFRIMTNDRQDACRTYACPTLSKILHSIKSFSANEINKLLGRKGPLWLDESFDHIVRHENEWEEKVAYIRRNAVKKGLAQKPEGYKWLWERNDRQDACRTDTFPTDACPTIDFEIFEPASEKEVRAGTVIRAKATCPCCGAVLPPERVRAQLSAQRGGADVVFKKVSGSEPPTSNPKPETLNHRPETYVRTGGARLLAVVTLKPGEQGRHYRLPVDGDYLAVWKAQQRLQEILEEWEQGGRKGLCPVPDEPLPPIGTLGFRVQRYGMLKWGDLFTARQMISMIYFSQKVSQSQIVLKERNDLLAIAVDRVADATASLTGWLASGEEVKHVFARQALPIVWDFGETNPLSDASRSWSSAIEAVSNVVSSVSSAQLFGAGQTQQADACQAPLPTESAGIFFTDPPYYDAIPYSDLSDFFLVWLKRSISEPPLFQDPFDPNNPLSPKKREAVQDETKKISGRPKDRSFFEETMAKAFSEGRRLLIENGIGSVVFAHKTTEGWEALLTGMIQGGWTITGSWPIATEAGNRLRARDSAALATSVHLVCRPRPEDAPIGDWSDVYRELPKRVGDWMERLQNEGVRGADLVFACIGPALEIFSRYCRVEDAAGNVIPLGGDPEAKEPYQRGFLAYVWETVGRIALEQVLGTAEAKARNGIAGALEEDARLTALFLWTLQSTNGNGDGKTKKGQGDETDEDDGEDDEDEAPKGKAKGYSLIFDVVRRFAQPLGIGLPKWEGRIIRTDKGVVRLLAVTERAKQLFGDEGGNAAADWVNDDPLRKIQLSLFPELEKTKAPAIRGRKKAKAALSLSTETAAQAGATTLDRVHAAMILQAGGQTNALRALIKAEQDRGPDFLRLANALSGLLKPLEPFNPLAKEEKRLLDAMLLAVPR